MARQLVFDLPARPALGREDYFVSPANRLAVAALDGWKGWRPGVRVLAGASGAGKSHLAQVWAAQSGAAVVAAATLGPDDVPALAGHGAVVVEDADRLARAPEPERALFHLYNSLLPEGRLLVTGRTPPHGWDIALPDLASRLRGAPVIALAAPDDTLLSVVLVKLLADRQIEATPAAIGFLVRRMERSFAAAAQVAAALDAAALERRRRTATLDTARAAARALGLHRAAGQSGPG